jgi:F0F1-type ATP synthase assembly protein I
MQQNVDRRKSRNNPWLAMGAGVELVVFSLAGLFAGRWADGRFETHPWLQLAGTLLGIGLGLYQFIQETSGARGRRA